MCVGIGFILIPTFANSAYRDMLPPKELVIDLTKFLDSRFVPIALIACMVFIFIISVVKAVTKNMNLVKTTNILSSGLDDAAGQIIGVGSMFMATAFIVFIIGQQGGLEVAHLKPTKFFRSGLEYWLLAFFGYWLGCRLNVFKPSIPTQDAN